jgi:heptosyltransferase-2
MAKLRLNENGVLVSDNRLKTFSVSQANLHPPKRIKQIEALIKTQHPSICVIRGEGIGDVLMTTPTIRALYQKFHGNISITYATNPKYLDGALLKVLQDNPYIEKVIDRENLNEEDYDAVVNLHCPAIAHEKPMAPPVNRIDLFAQHAGVYPLADTSLTYTVTEEEKTEANAFLNSLGLNPVMQTIIMINLFSSSTTRSLDKQVVLDSLKQLSSLNMKLLLITHDSDSNTASSFKNIANLHTVKGKDIRELSAILTQINLLLCPDSALLHAAGALNIPTVALFAPTDPRARVNYYPNAKAIWGGEGLNGHPHWYEACPFGDICWKRIKVEDIVKAVMEKLNSIPVKNQSIISTDLV